MHRRALPIGQPRVHLRARPSRILGSPALSMVRHDVDLNQPQFSGATPQKGLQPVLGGSSESSPYVRRRSIGSSVENRSQATCESIDLS